MDDKIYWHRGRNTPPTSSSVLVSSSPYLNDPRFREWISTEALRKNGPDYPLLFGMPTMTQALEQVRDVDRINALFAEERSRNPKLDAWFKEGFVSAFTKEDLRRQPAGSIGRILFEYMDENGFELELSPKLQADPTWKPSNDYEYWNLRSGQTHDFDHILAEVGFDYISEAFPAFFRIGNLYRHFSPELAGELSVMQMFISWPWYMRTILHYPTCWPAFFDGMVNGYACGQASDMINMARYDDILHLTPAEARDRVGVRNIVPADTNALSAIWYGTATMRVNDPAKAKKP
jgi:hypothetical protein